MENRNKQKASLKLKFVPFLALRARIFELNNVNLNKFVEDLFRINPFIEETNTYSYEDYIFDQFSEEEDIYSFLEHQVNMLEIGEKKKTIASFIVNNLNEEGYLKIDLKEIATHTGTCLKDVESTLKIIQTLDPPGIAARDLSECFILQLEREGSLSPKIKKIIKDYLPALSTGKLKDLSKRFGVSEEYLKKLRSRIGCLNPSPGLMFKEPKEQRKIPDLVIERDGDRFVALLNKGCRREFVISDAYRKALSALDKERKEEFEALLEKATWVMRAIEERDNLLLKIGDEIASINTDFFEGKRSFPEKISLSQFSEEHNMSHSILSRLAQNKYILTPKGIFPVHFFIRRTGVSYNDEEVKARIKTLIEMEDKKNPLTDEMIASALKKDGIRMSRRTVAKYRNFLRIPHASKRKLDEG